ncbi:MAG: hypothetical protein EXX96DRAFT_482929, partial [Benjaminiella poitrasii]
LFGVMNSLPKDFASISVSPTTVLWAPLANIYLPIQPDSVRSITQRLCSSVAYTVDLTSDQLRPRLHSELSGFPRLAK